MKVLATCFVGCIIGAGTCAQPGSPPDTRTPEEIRQQLDARLKEVDDQINKNPDQSFSYERRARVYAELHLLTKDELEKPFFFDKAIADFNKAIELDLNHWPIYVERARFRLMSDQLKYFNEIRSDYRAAIRIIEKAEPNSSWDYQLHLLNNNLSYLYVYRGETLVTSPNLIAGLYLDPAKYSPWDDFDRAIEYAKKGVRVSAHWWNVVNPLTKKGDLALKLSDYERALAAYHSDEEHMGQEYELVCKDASSDEDPCHREQRDFLLTFSIRRGRANLKLGRAADALKDLTVYSEKAYHVECQAFFKLRAQAHRALGNEAQAKADEETAKTRGSVACPFDIQN